MIKKEMINNVLKMPKNSQKWLKNDKKVDICGSVGGGRNFYIPRKIFFFPIRNMIKNHQKNFQVNQTITSKDIWMSGTPPPKNAIFGGGFSNINGHLPRMVLT